MHARYRISGTGFKRSSWGLLALGVALIVILWSNLLLTYQDLETQQVRDFKTHLANLAEALSLQTDSVLRGVDSVAIRLRREYQTRPSQAFQADTHGFINNAMQGFAVQVVLVARDGMLAWSSEPAPFPMDLNDRAYFSAHAQAATADRLFIGTPILNRINLRWIIPVSRPLLRADTPGKPPIFDGVIMISLDPRHFANLLRRVDLGRNGMIAIVSAHSGEFLVHSRPDESWIGTRIATAPFLDPAAPQRGSFILRDDPDGIERLAAYQHLPEYGIALVAGLDLKAALAPLQHRAHGSYALALVVSSAIALLVLYLALLLRRHGETEAELETEHRILCEAERIGQVGSWQWDLDGNRLLGSEQLHRLFCFTQTWGPIPMVQFFERIYPEDQEKVRRALCTARAGDGPLHNLEFRIRCPDGTLRTVLACGAYSQADKRQMIGTLLDITTLRDSQKQLLQAQIVFDNALEGVVVSDAQGIIQAVNPAFEHITGYSRAEAIGARTNLLNSGHHPPEFYQHMWGRLAQEGRWEGEIWNRRKDGSLYVEWLTIRAVRDPFGQVQQYVALFADITDRKRREEAVWHRAYHDALTGLANRSLFQDRLEHALRTARRDARELALFFIDLDRFKEINDTLGHAAGDELLRQVAERLEASVRASDSVARLAGDEFVALIESVPDAAALTTLARKMLKQLSAPFALKGGTESISASIGIARYPADGQTPEALMQAADRAMYAAKHAGRNRYRFAGESPAAAAL